MTDCGIVMLVNVVQPENANGSIVSKPFGSVGVAKLVQPRNAFLPMDFKAVGNSTFCKPLLLEKANSSMVVTDCGSAICVKKAL